MRDRAPWAFMKGREAPSDEKELPTGPPDSTEEDPELPGPPELMARPSKHVRGPLSDGRDVNAVPCIF